MPNMHLYIGPANISSTGNRRLIYLECHRRHITLVQQPCFLMVHQRWCVYRWLMHVRGHI